ncbi:MAG: acyltransferase [Comamonadaceae bacterium]|nr:MAG: acyltransferase [Comamonadaceae bacterium]
MQPQAEAHPLVHPKYRPDIDGLRAIAVLSVVGYHAFPAWIRGGFIGVDIFFVISGFLISTIIVGSLSGDGFSYREFYARRIRRIFPALLPVMALTFAFGWYVLLADEFLQLGKHLVASAGFVSNLVLWREAGYFDVAAETKPLLHLWSLAVEEQFYIFWPVLLALVWRWKGASGLFFWMAVAAVLSFLLNVAGVHRHPDATFYSPLSRVWELAAGALLAQAGMRRPTRPSARSDKAFPGWWAILPVAGACLLISAGPAAWLNRNVLGSRIFVWFGLISYPLYLWHWPLLAFARIVEGATPSRTVRIGAVVLAILLAWLTYRFIERPARRGGAATVRMLAFGMAGLALLGALAFMRQLPPRNSALTLQAIVSAGTDWAYPDGLKPVTVNGQSILQLGTGSKQVLLLGDSHVEQFAPRAVELSRTQPERLNSLYFATRGACPPIPGLLEDRDPVCGERFNQMLRFALSPQIDTVVIGGCWACYFDVGPQPPPAGAPPAPDHYYLLENGVRHMLRGGDGLDRSFEALGKMLKSLKAAGKTVYLILNVPVGENFEPKSLIAGSRLSEMNADRTSATSGLTASQKALHDRLEGVAKDSGAIVLDPLATLCNPAGQCLRSEANGVPIYKDLTHLRASYVRRSATFLDPALIQ